jgi:hypothetical protein
MEHQALALVLILLIAVFITMFIIDGIPNMPFKEDYRSVVTASKPYLKDNKIAKEYKVSELSSMRRSCTATTRKSRIRR